jgi:hypothetical protein
MFQVNPRRFDIVGAMRTGRHLRWSLRQHARDVVAGDPALIWMSGSSRGIFAVGQVVAVSPDEPEVADWEREFELEPFDPTKRTSIAELDVRAVAPVSAAILKRDPVLSNLLVLRRPNSTVFRVSDDEWSALGPMV